MCSLVFNIITAPISDFKLSNKRAHQIYREEMFKYTKEKLATLRRTRSSSMCRHGTRRRNRFQSGKPEVACFLPCSWVLYSSPCEAVLETPRCLHLYRLGWVCYNVAISLLIRITVTKLQYSQTAREPRTAQLPQSKRHAAARTGEHAHFPPNSQAYPPHPRVFQH